MEVGVAMRVIGSEVETCLYVEGLVNDSGGGGLATQEEILESELALSPTTSRDSLGMLQHSIP